jgi:hypothetical protein
MKIRNRESRIRAHAALWLFVVGLALLIPVRPPGIIPEREKVWVGPENANCPFSDECGLEVSEDYKRAGWLIPNPLSHAPPGGGSSTLEAFMANYPWRYEVYHEHGNRWNVPPDQSWNLPWDDWTRDFTSDWVDERVHLAGVPPTDSCEEDAFEALVDEVHVYAARTATWQRAVHDMWSGSWQDGMDNWARHLEIHEGTYLAQAWWRQRVYTPAYTMGNYPRRMNDPFRFGDPEVNDHANAPFEYLPPVEHSTWRKVWINAWANYLEAIEGCI